MARPPWVADSVKKKEIDDQGGGIGKEWNSNRPKEGNQASVLETSLPSRYDDLVYDHNFDGGIGGSVIIGGYMTGEGDSRKTNELESNGVIGGKSYRDMVLGAENEDVLEEDIVKEDEEGEGEKEEGGDCGVIVKECLIGGYECPTFVLSKYEEKRIQRPRRRGVIIKLLGRKIGYKALETRLRQMWVRRGVISIIDLGNDYYLVAFSHEDDKNVAMTEGLWFIYDHYLTVKEWCPNFHSESDTIGSVTV